MTDTATVTEQGMERLMRAVAAARPHQPIDDDVIAFWRRRLSAHHITDDDAFAAVEQLADRPDRYDLSLGAVVELAQVERDRRRQRERFLQLESGERRPDRGGALPAGARGWCVKCRSALLGYDPPDGDICRNCDPSYLRSYGTRNRR